MRTRFLELLCCPDCRADLSIHSVADQEGDAIVQGQLTCNGCGRVFPVENRVPVFDGDEYVDNFGWQWTRFHRLQRDSYNGTDIVRQTILKRSGWEPGHLADKVVLECGCGSGNDTEVLASLAETVVSFDLSEAVHSFAPEVLRRDNVLVMRANLLKVPVKESLFDIVFCHRVIHHTPDPRASFASITRYVRPGGQVFLECYSRHWKSMLNYKYWLRPITTRLPHALVFRLLRIAGPVLYAVHAVLHRLAFLRRLNRLLIPFEYHSRMLSKEGSTLTFRERYEYSFLITFDALTPVFDNPQRPETIRAWCEELGFEDVVTRSINPVVTTCRRPVSQAAPEDPGDVHLAPRPRPVDVEREPSGTRAGRPAATDARHGA